MCALTQCLYLPRYLLSIAYTLTIYLQCIFDLFIHCKQGNARGTPMGNAGWRWLSGPVTDVRMINIKKSKLHVVRQCLASRSRGACNNPSQHHSVPFPCPLCQPLSP
jgi:hypothetical protein